MLLRVALPRLLAEDTNSHSKSEVALLKERKRPHRENDWSKEELKTLEELYDHADKTLEEIASHLPRRTRNAITLKASRLGLYRPTPYSLSFCPHCGQPLKEEPE
jgi:hypothetical protein